MQRYLWQQADGKRHVYDTDTYSPMTGRPFQTLCGTTVTPQQGDMVAGMWWDPECEECLLELVRLSGWTPDEIARLSAIRKNARSHE